ncbi:hypothetical protein MPC4_200055 [Methylocella tundrae]|uniref:MacB-like periplasmic core domain-containing protein n=1 Tax=Methylocella tundrae TaxID=227605 RepID=A0A8B6M587_METTU|nr:ABC transporter permease [Methylocella tundrae]VTZ28185.1 hypothetical protein MPC1_80015 [Methylocella tundrae]VTZ50171.1 hypothetical protein MPC4_200055 [Methylocella tundrae]
MPATLRGMDRRPTRPCERVRPEKQAGAARKLAPGGTPVLPLAKAEFHTAAAIQVAGFWTFALMILASAAQAIGRNKMRSALTMLGVFIGVAALIVMVAVGQGANEAVRKQIESLGTNVVVILLGGMNEISKHRHSRLLPSMRRRSGRLADAKLRADMVLHISLDDDGPRRPVYANAQIVGIAVDSDRTNCYFAQIPALRPFDRLGRALRPASRDH